MNPIEFQPQILWQNIEWWKVKHPICLYLVQIKTWSLFFHCVFCLLRFSIWFSIFCLSWLLANRQGEGEKQWWSRKVVCIPIPKCFPVGWLSFCRPSVSQFRTSFSLCLSLSLSLKRVWSCFQTHIRFGFSLLQGPQLKPCLSVWVLTVWGSVVKWEHQSQTPGTPVGFKGRNQGCVHQKICIVDWSFTVNVLWHVYTAFSLKCACSIFGHEQYWLSHEGRLFENTFPKYQLKKPIWACQRDYFCSNLAVVCQGTG